MSEPERRDKLTGLEGLRGILALLVCVGHLGLNTGAAKLGMEVRFGLAVDVFFAISGFVLSRAYYLERRSFAALVVSRVARLYPLHLLTMTWCLLLSGLIEWPLIVQNLTLTQNLGLPPNRWGYNFPSWSISVEMAVSLLFWWIVRRETPKLAAALLVSGLALCAFETASGMTPALNHAVVFNSGLMRGVAGFALGVVAYLATRHAPHMCARLAPFALPAVALLLALFVLQSWWWLSGLVFAIAVFVAVLAVAAAGDVPVLSSRPLVWLGAISYSVYLLHIPVHWSATALFGDRVLGLGKPLLLAAILIASHLCFRLFELPMQRALLDLLRVRRRAPT